MSTGKKHSSHSFKKLIPIVIGLVSFTVISGNSLLKLFTASSITQHQSEIVENESTSNQLEVREQGYLTVLEREPENKIALEGLVQTQIKLDKKNEALINVNRLVELEPGNSEYQRILNSLKQES